MNIGRNDIDWRNLSHDEIDRIIAERIEADDRRIEASGGKKPKEEEGLTFWAIASRKIMFGCAKV